MKNDVHQLGVILYPPEVLNEKFLIKLRDCVLKLPEDHPLKRWMKWAAMTKRSKGDEAKTQVMLNEIINSKFNLITDHKVKKETIQLLHSVPENTLSELLLKSYLYLMIGNITRSDNILRSIMKTTPLENWQRFESNPSFYHRIATAHAQELLQKLSKHPTDRRTFQLFILYLTKFYNDENVQNLVSDLEKGDIESMLDLKYVEGIAPSFVHFLRISRMGENRRMKLLRDLEKFPLEEQAYWIWPFIDIDPLISEQMVDELAKLEKTDELWFIFLMNNEKLADLYSKKHKRSFLPGRRPFLKSKLSDERSFMLSLYKLIELGDINPELISSTINFLTNE